MAEKARVYGESYPIDEDFLSALPAYAGSVRLCTRLRPAGHAGDGRKPYRAGDLDTGAMNAPFVPFAISSRPASCPPRKPPRSSEVAARYAVAIPPALAALIDQNDPNDPIARQYVPDEAELVTLPEERRDPIGDLAFIHRSRAWSTATRTAFC